MSRQLAAYLEQLAFEGERDSQGSFTVDYARALELFSRRLYSDPTSYLIKLAQAAFAGGAPELQVRTRREHLELSFQWHTLDSATLTQLPDWLHQDLGLELPRPAAHLLRGLHTARATHPQSQIGLAVQDEAGGLTCLIEGESIRSQPMAAKAGRGTNCVITIRHLGPTPKGRPHNWLPEQTALTARCALTSRPVRWDGKLLNPLSVAVDSQPARYPVLLDRIYFSRRPAAQLLGMPHLTTIPAVVYDVGGGYQDLYSLGQTLLHQWRGYLANKALGPPLWEECSRPDFRLLESDVVQEVFGIPADGYAVNHGFIRAGRMEGRGNGYQILYVVNAHSYTFTPFTFSQGRFGKKASPCAQAWLRCPALPRGDSRLHLQVDGVLLDPLPIELPLAGAELIVADSEVKTDLSGLVPIADERLESIVRWFSVDLGKSKKDLRKALRWNDKYGLSEDWVKQVYRTHRLDLDE